MEPFVVPNSQIQLDYEDIEYYKFQLDTCKDIKSCQSEDYLNRELRYVPCHMTPKRVTVTTFLPLTCKMGML